MSVQKEGFQVDADNAPEKWMNRRAAVRYHAAPATPGRVFFHKSIFWVWIQDLSKTGAGLLLAERIEPGWEITLQIISPSDHEKYEFLAEVVHVTRNFSGEWSVGVRFHAELSAEQLELLL